MWLFTSGLVSYKRILTFCFLLRFMRKFLIFFRMKIFAYRIYHRVVQFFVDYPLISAETLALVKHLSFLEYLVWLVSRQTILNLFIGGLRTLCILVGFYSIVQEAVNYGLPPLVFLYFIVCLLIYACLRKKDSLLYIISLLSYLYFLSYFYGVLEFSEKNWDLGKLYLILFLLIAFIRPFWFFIFDVIWYVILRQSLNWNFASSVILLLSSQTCLENLKPVKISEKEWKTFFKNAKHLFLLLLIFVVTFIYCFYVY